MTLPTLTRTIDDDFTNTWYEIRAEAIDNILEATVLWLAFKEFGCFTPQSGGEYITRTVRYAVKSMQRIAKGTTLTQSEHKGRTMGIWDWKYVAVDVNRSFVDDQKNKGKFRIKSYVADRLEAARDGLVQDLETDLFRFAGYATNQIYGMWDCVPCDAARTITGGATTTPAYSSGTWGGISQTNSWWQTNIDVNNSQYAVNLVPTWRTFYNNITANMTAPNFVICNQTLFEAYEDEVGDRQQIVRTSFDNKAADLGFDTFTFKGATIAWTGKLATGAATVGETTDYVAWFLNMDYIDVVYDPDAWFDMTGWKESVNQLERVAYIASALTGPITAQPRRHGFLDFTS
jgi:hypothetical protein